MKKYMMFCLLAMVAAGFMSCEKNTPVECNYHSKTIYLTVAENQWDFDQQTQQFYCSFDVPEITASVYDFGNYSLHREYFTGTADAYQVGLPQTVYILNEIDDGQGNITEELYQQHIDYRVGIGYVDVNVTNSDFMYDPGTPGEMVFHLQLVY